MIIYLGIMYSQSKMDQVKSVLESERPSLLQSFYYDKEVLKCSDDIMFDSGAFTMFSSMKNTSINWDEYVDSYADFVKKNNIGLFLELDIDPIVGYDRVKELRKRLESKVGRQCIPVWHKSRGLDDFKRMTKEYGYVAIGGIVSGEIKKQEFPVLKEFIKMAHKDRAKIHGLGFTKIDILDQYHWDSVDSVSWKSGNMYGYCYKFDGKTMRKIYPGPNQKFVGGRDAFSHDLQQWIAYQKYAKENL